MQNAANVIHFFISGDSKLLKDFFLLVRSEMSTKTGNNGLEYNNIHLLSLYCFFKLADKILFYWLLLSSSYTRRRPHETMTNDNFGFWLAKVTTALQCTMQLYVCTVHRDAIPFFILFS